MARDGRVGAMMLGDRGVLLIWIIVGQWPTVLAVGAARVVLATFVPLSGKWAYIE